MALKPVPLIILILILAALAGGTWFALTRTPEAVPDTAVVSVHSFEECAAAGYPVRESYPRQCATPDGRVYAEELPAPEPTYLNASADLIRIENPTPGAVVGKPFTVVGAARGTWYFEASFPIELLDAEGEVIAQGLGQPVDGADWMTEDFVPFTATIEVPESYIGEAVLVIKNDNPSGLPENARSISFPITVEY